MWLKWSFAPAPFTGNYVLGFIIVLIMIMTIRSWLFTGCIGWRALTQSQWHIVWCAFLILLVLWSLLSQFWAFGLQHYPGMARTAGLQLLLVGLFALIIVAAAPSKQILLAVLILSMLIHGSIGGLQVLLQHKVGLSWLGEFPLDVYKSGVSVLESNGVRWLRPYGLLPHPNLLAGVIVLGLFATSAWILDDGKKRVFGNIAFLIGFWLLLLTFSRSGWIGFAAGSLFALPFVYRIPHFWRKIAPTIIGALLVGVVFVLLFHPLLLSRAGVSEQNTEMRSVSDRIVYIEIAVEAIQEYPLQGVGTGNFPWYASNYLYFRTDYDLRGDNVHNIYLGILSELGFVGFALFLGMVLSAIGATLRQRNTENIALLAGFIGWAVIGLFDHYMWTLIITQVLWIGILALGMSGTDEIASPTKT